MKKYFLLSIVCSSLFYCFSAFAETTTISQKNAIATNLGLYGSYTWDIAVDPTDNSYIYLATYYSPNGFFRSQDGGETWQGLPEGVDHGSGKEVEVNSSNGNVYALLDGLWVSTDHGATFREAYYTEASTLLYANNALYMGTSNGEIKITADEAVSFASYTVCEGKTIWSLAISNDALYALCYDYNAGSSSLYKSIDDGLNWSDLEITENGVIGAERVEVNPVNNSVFLIPSSTGGTTYRSIDGGLTWLPLADAPLTSRMDFNSTGRIYVGWYYSDDNGDTWSSFGIGGSYNHIMMPDPTNDAILYNTSTPGFLKSTDSGATWTSSVKNITGVEVTSISQAADKNTVWVATQNGPALTTDFLSEAPTWEYKTPNSNFISSSYDSVWVKPDNTNFVVASSSKDLYYSIDGGTSWLDAAVDIDLIGAVFQIASDADNNLYAVVGPNISTGEQTGGVIKSADYGATWASLNFPDDMPARSISVGADGDIYVGAHSAVGGIYKYDGSSWAKLSVSDTEEFISIIIDPQDDNTIYALARNAGIFKSIDAGINWEQKNEGLGDISKEFNNFDTLAIQTSTDPDSLYLSGVKSQTQKGVIYKSSDGAENWNRLYTGKSGETFNTLLFDGLVAGNSRGIYDIKSRAVITLKKIADNLKITLKDAATDKLLKNKKIKIYKKRNNKWKHYRTIRTSKNGARLIPLNIVKNTKFKAVWSPTGKFIEEYSAVEKIKKIAL